MLSRSSNAFIDSKAVVNSGISLILRSNRCNKSKAQFALYGKQLDVNANIGVYIDNAQSIAFTNL